MKRSELELPRVSTANMAEVIYLVTACGHRIVAVEEKTSWPYGVEELCVTLAGQTVEDDHWTYLKYGHCKLDQLPKAFDAILAALERQQLGGDTTRGGVL